MYPIIRQSNRLNPGIQIGHTSIPNQFKYFIIKMQLTTPSASQHEGNENITSDITSDIP